MKLFNLAPLPLIQLWAACHDAGFALVWSPARRCVILRPIEGGAP
jgi:hypothetical protein